MRCASLLLHLGLIGLCAIRGTVALLQTTDFHALVDSLNLPNDPDQINHISADGILRVFAVDGTVLGYVRLTAEQLQHWIDSHASVLTEEELRLLQEAWANADTSKVSEEQIWNPSADLLPQVLVNPQQERPVTPAPAMVVRRKLVPRLICDAYRCTATRDCHVVGCGKCIGVFSLSRWGTCC
ncbi:hypothetical protein AJ78_05023 [Emergomyces pasteurianus Ep9510]|uniref:Uncharacterized protein n=1 Tax=Emergomyces pasteurianus Ep9510 TaxID=1447872 RepID=A0A1J9QET4_9EURO|nr:hypothetical protein AJ78_05023 [Emergomyces pasteurianus Ep9510]